MRGRSPALAPRYCSGCGAAVDEWFAVQRHNQECAETGERSYPGHRLYLSLARQVEREDQARRNRLTALDAAARKAARDTVKADLMADASRVGSLAAWGN